MLKILTRPTTSPIQLVEFLEFLGLPTSEPDSLASLALNAAVSEYEKATGRGVGVYRVQVLVPVVEGGRVLLPYSPVIVDDDTKPFVLEVVDNATGAATEVGYTRLAWYMAPAELIYAGAPETDTHLRITYSGGVEDIDDAEKALIFAIAASKFENRADVAPPALVPVMDSDYLKVW